MVLDVALRRANLAIPVPCIEMCTPLGIVAPGLNNVELLDHTTPLITTTKANENASCSGPSEMTTSNVTFFHSERAELLEKSSAKP